MLIILAALMLSGTRPMLSQGSCGFDGPRILHGMRSSTIFSYPSLGGYVRKEITRVELDWLDMKSPTNSSDSLAFKNSTKASYGAREEDILALRMMQLGAHWWPNRRLYNRHTNSYGDATPYGHHFPPEIDVCYPSSGGLLVLRTWAGNSPYLDGLPGVAPERPDEWSRLSLCTNMEERCEVLRDFGAEFYESVQECPDVPASLEEGVAMGREYERLLKLMGDRDYVVEWWDSF